MDLSNLNIKNLDHLGLVAGLCKEVGIAQIIDKLIPSSANDKIISNGKCLEAMILNGLGFTGRTLHMYEMDPNYWYIFFKQKGTFLFLQLRGHFKIGLT